jgi:hypothetical protein
VIDVLDRDIELLLVPFGIAAILAAAIGENPQQPDLLAVEEGNHAIVEKIGRSDRRLAIVKLGKGDLSVGVDEGCW